MHVVPSKATSNDKFAAERIVDDIVYLGHTRVILRSDNEPALLALVTDALKGPRIQLLDSAAAEGSVPYNPQTAGAAEVSVKNLKGQVRAMHLTLDRFMEKHVPVAHPLIAWLVEHAAFVRLTGVIGQDGKTAYHRIQGTEHRLRLPFFGEKVRYKCRSQEGGVAGEGSRWSDGIFVGIHRRTNQYVMFDPMYGIRETRTIMRYPHELKFDPELAQTVK